MLTEVSLDLKAKGNSIANLGYTLLGWLPAPVIYGWICEGTGGDKSRYGLASLINIVLVSIIFVIMAIIKKKVK